MPSKRIKKKARAKRRVVSPRLPKKDKRRHVTADMSGQDVQRLVQELQVHQVELESQNEELRWTQLQLELARNRYADLYEFSPAGLLTLDARHQIMEANLRACALFGVKRTDLMQQPLVRLIAPEDADGFYRHCQDVVKNGMRQTCQVRLRDETQGLRWIHCDSVALDDEPGCWRTALFDITDQKRIEQELQIQRARFDGIINSTMDAIVTVDEDQRIVVFNAAAEAMFLCPAEAAIGQPLDQFIPKRFREAHRYHIQNFAQSARNAAQLRSLVGLRTNGEEFPFEGSVSQVSVGEGKLLTAILRDRTERQRAETALRESEERMRAFLENSATIAWIKDAEGRYIYLSPNYQRRFNVRLDEWLGKTDVELWPQEIAEQFRANDLTVLREDRRMEMIEPTPNADGSLSWWLNSKFPYRDAGGKRYVGGLGVDITNRKRAEEELSERARHSAFAADVSVSLIRNEPLGPLLQRCARAVVEHLGLAFARIWVLGAADLCERCHRAACCDDRIQCLHLQASAGLSTNLDGEYRRVPLGALKIGRIAQTASAMISHDILQDDHLQNKQWMRDNGLRSFAGFPLVVEGRVYGVLGVFGREALSATTLQTLELVCHSLAAAIARKEAEERLHENQGQLRHHQAQLEDLMGKLITAQESERQRISRDLHDDFSQRVAALVLDVAALERQPPVLPELIPHSLEPVREQLERLADDIHTMAYKLHPSLLEHAGLQPAMEDHIQQVANRTGLRIVLKAREVPNSLSLDQSTCLFRVLQEALHNVIKHANATEATIKLSGSSKGVGVSVMDNGKGFDAIDKSAHQTGLGLISMQERLRLLEGFLRIHSRPSEGTKVCAWIPFKEAAT